MESGKITGSRNSDGNVPNVNWNPDNRKVYVNWYNSDNANDNLRSRSEVSGARGRKTPLALNLMQDLFEKIISLENLFLSWKEFKKGKTKKKDVQEFSKKFRTNLFALHKELGNKTYEHSRYFSFYIKDPKLRHIHKATVKDRVLHHAIFRILYPIFDKSFIFDSYSCRLGKGTHGAINRLQEFAGKVCKNNSRNCFILKCDVRKYFDSIGQDILTGLIKKKINDENTIWLVNKIVESYSTSLGRGIPLGNITSQLFANIYLNELDGFVKHKLKIKYYIRYCDDFVILDGGLKYLQDLIPKIENFIENKLKLCLHEKKIVIRNYRQGVDFLGYVCFPHHRILRVKTRKRMFRNIKHKIFYYKQGIISKESFNQTIQSYLGVLSHCNSYKIKMKIFKMLLLD